MAGRLEGLFALRDIGNHVVDSDPFSASITRTTGSPAHRTPKKVLLPSSQKSSPTQRSVNDKAVTSHLDRLEGILSGFTSFAASCPTHFFLSKECSFPGAILTPDKRTVTRYRLSDSPLVHLSKPLEAGKKLILRVDGLPDTTFGYAFIFLVKYSFDGDPVWEKEVPQFATPGTIVSFELATGKKLIVISVTRNSVLKTHYLYLDQNSTTKTLFPAIRMSGNTSVVTITSDAPHFFSMTEGSARDPIRKRPNASSSHLLRPPRPSSSASSAYSSLTTTPSPPKQQSLDYQSDLGNEEMGTEARVEDKAVVDVIQSAGESKVREQKVVARPKSVPRAVNDLNALNQASGTQPQVRPVGPEQKRNGEPVKKKPRNKRRKWFSNQFMRCESSVITRIRSPSDRNYIFSSLFRVNQTIVIKIVDVEPSDSEVGTSVRLGYTTTPLLEVDTSILPDDPRDVLLMNHSNSETKWRLSANLFTFVGAFDGLRFTRTETGIQMSIDSGESVLVMDADAAESIFPFIHMSGCVKSLSVVTL